MALLSHTESFSALRNMLESVLESKDVDSRSLVDYLLFRFKKLRFSSPSDGDAVVNALRGEIDPAGGMKPSLLFDLVEAVCEEMPLVLILDDVHFGDESTAAFIEAFAMGCSSRKLRCMLIATLNPREVFPNTVMARSLKKLSRYEGACLKKIRLAPLSDANMFKILSETYHLDQMLARTFIKFLSGNPLFAREVVRMHVEERLLKSNDSGTYQLNERLVPKMEVPVLVREMFSDYFTRVKSYLSNNAKAELIDDLLLRLAILGSEIEDELLEAYIEAEGRADLIDNLDEIIETFISINLLSETMSRNAKTALSFGSEAAPMSILSAYSQRKLRPLHKLAAQTKHKYYTVMDRRSYLEMTNHYMAVGARDEAEIYMYKSMQQAAEEDDQQSVYHNGMLLYNSFNEKFLSIGQTNAEDAESLLKPINWPQVIQLLGRAMFYMGRSYEADQLTDKLVYCAQRYQLPILQGRAYVLMALFSLLREEFDTALANLDESEKNARQYGGNTEDFAHITTTKLWILANMGSFDKVRELSADIQQMLSATVNSDDPRAQSGAKLIQTFCSFFEAISSIYIFDFHESLELMSGTRNIFAVYKMHSLVKLCDHIISISQMWLNPQDSLPRDLSLGEGNSGGNISALTGYAELFYGLYLALRDRANDGLALISKSEKYFKLVLPDSQTNTGLSFSVLMRAMISMLQLDFKTALVYYSESFRLSLRKSKYSMGSSMLGVAQLAILCGDQHRASLYLKTAQRLLEQSCKDFLFLEATHILYQYQQESSTAALLERMDAYFTRKNAHFNLPFSVSLYAMLAATQTKDIARLQRYYAEFTKSSTDLVDAKIFAILSPGGLGKILEFIDETQNAELSIVAMRAGIAKLQERWGVYAVDSKGDLNLDFSIFDGSIDNLDV